MSYRTINFQVKGSAQPGGSKTAVPTRNNWRKVAGVRWQVIDANKNAAGWKDTVGKVAKVAMVDALGWNPAPLDGPLYVRFEFVAIRPPTHILSDGFSLSAAGRQFPERISKPDVLKLARTVEDGMTGIVYGDDAQIVEEMLIKRWGSWNGVDITVSQIPLDGSAGQVVGASLFDDEKLDAWAKASR